MPARCLPHRGADRPLARAGWWSDAPPQQQCVRAFVSLRRNAKCQCSCVCVLLCACAANVKRHTPAPGHTFIPPLQHRPPQGVHTCAPHPEAPSLGGGRLWGWQSLQHSAGGSSPCVSRYAQWGLCMAAVASPVFRRPVHLPAPARWRWVGAGTCSPLGRSSLVCVVRSC